MQGVLPTPPATQAQSQPRRSQVRKYNIYLSKLDRLLSLQRLRRLAQIEEGHGQQDGSPRVSS
jgi:hypothetical protein